MRQEWLCKRKTEIQGLCGRIAHRYDLLNRVLSLGRDVSWRRMVSRKVAEEEPRLVLDVCTGTGDLAMVVTSGLVIGSDFCLPMLDRARRKGEGKGLRLPLCAADALHLPYPDACFDAVTVAFGVRNFADLDAGLAEMVRVLRAGGLLVVLEFSRPRGALAPILGWWVRNIPPRVGRMLSGDAEAYSYLPASVQTFPEGREMCERLESAGLVETSAETLTAGVASIYEGRRVSENRALVEEDRR